MNIHSTPLPLSNGPMVSAFDTVVDGKSLVVATAVSSNGGRHLTEDGQDAIKAMARHQRTHYPKGMIHVASIPDGGCVLQTVQRLLGRASHGDAVVFMGADDNCCKAVVQELHLTDLRGFRLQ